MGDALAVESVFGRRSRIAEMVEKGVVGQAVLDELFVGTTAINDEAVLWDFKRELPLNPSQGTNEATRAETAAKFCEVIKDCVAFYNSYGGYLVVGVDDASRAIVGYGGQFDASDLNKRIEGATGVSIETHFRLLPSPDPSLEVGLLFIPKRRIGTSPAQFKKDAPPSPYGRRAYDAKQFYLRIRDTCCAASTPDDYEFLYGERHLGDGASFVVRLDNTLPPRDPELGELRGREHEMTELWRWLSDSFSPVRILCGLGGLGKTSIAFTFAERLVFHSAPEIDRLVWLGAKETTYSALLDSDVVMPRVDFASIDGMLRELLLETGCPEDHIPDQPTREQLLELAREHLSAFRYLLILDNLDTLPDDEQQQVFHLITQLCAMTGTKALLTARRNLGAPRSAFTEIEGLPHGELEALVQDKCELLRLKQPSAEELKELHSASGGSPLFALSILRLVSLGDSFKVAVQHWKGGDGEDVRDAAFLREVARLTPNQGRVMLALSYLEEASAVELSSLLKLTRLEVQSALEGLRALSMTTFASDLPGGAAFGLPPALSLVRPLLEKRIPDFAEIRRTCAQLKVILRDKDAFVGQAVSRAMAALSENDPDLAVSIAREAVQKLPENGDLRCLLGRCLFEWGKQEAAEEAFEAASRLGCEKKELFDHWIELRRRREDWRGLIALGDQAEKRFPSSRYVTLRNQARCNVGDELARTGNYVDAAGVYEQCISEVREGLLKYNYGPDRAALWRLNETVVTRWLGVVKMECERRPNGQQRFFGACYKAITSYKHLSKQTLQSALSALEDWIAKLEPRPDLSVTTRENLEIAQNRLAKLVGAVELRSDVLGDFARQFIVQAEVFSTSLKELLSR